MSVGIYKVHALAYDGNIYVRTAEPATLTIYKQYYVQFNANGGEGNMEKQSFVCDETQALNANQFTREGYAFLGWSTTQNGEVEYGDKAEVTNLTTTNNATVNLYAKWQSQTPTYTINFDKQNGTNGTSSATVQYQNNNYSVNPVVAPARTDYTFGGYYTQAEGAGVTYSLIIVSQPCYVSTPPRPPPDTHPVLQGTCSGKLAPVPQPEHGQPRGFKFLPVSLKKSDAKAFLPEDGKIRLPFSSLSGLGENAALNIIKAREEDDFFSVEDLRIRAKLTKAVIEILRNSGVLDELDETDQLSFF